LVGTSLGAVLDGVHASVVLVEADVSSGLPNFSIVGLPDSAVTESKLRIRSAIKNAGFDFPTKRITVNLSPASMKKRGAGLDLAIAIAILRASGQIPQPEREPHAFCAELGLSGQLVPVTGLANMAFALSKSSVQHVVVASLQSHQCLPIPDIVWHAFPSLRELVSVLKGGDSLPIHHVTMSHRLERTDEGDFAEVIGLEDIKRALCIAAVGQHHMLLVGPPGCGKTMMAERFPSILPSLTPIQAFEIHALHQAAGLNAELSCTPPLRSPHHSVTVAGLVGGGMPPTPGEVTLSHHGVLLLDELLEYARPTLEALREPLTTGCVRLARAGKVYEMPAKFQLLGTLNPCPCGQRGYGECRCMDSAVKRYWMKLSGPLLDRVDMMLYISPRSKEDAKSPSVRDGQLRDSSSMRQAVTKARELLRHVVAQTSRDEVAHRAFPITSDAKRLLQRAATALPLSQRGVQAVLRVATSVSAFEGDSTIHSHHIEEAIALRSHRSMGAESLIDV
jgi:magnesium chelatase family protein